MSLGRWYRLVRFLRVGGCNIRRHGLFLFVDGVVGDFNVFPVRSAEIGFRVSGDIGEGYLVRLCRSLGDLGLKMSRLKCVPRLGSMLWLEWNHPGFVGVVTAIIAV
jgi:hypothetical protein